MSEDEGQEKSHDPTPQRLQKAREDGNIPQSRDAHAAAAYIGFTLALILGARWSAERFGNTFAPMLARPDQFVGRLLGPGGSELALHLTGEALTSIAPYILVPALCVAASMTMQQSVAVAGKRIEPKLSRLSIPKNAANKFGPTGLVEFLKSVVKMSAVATVVWLIMSRSAETLMNLPRANARALPSMLGAELLAIIGPVTGIAAIIALVDLLWQRFDHRRKLRMSHQDMREEAKQSEGDPHLRSKRMQRGREIATNRMLLDVPKADVVIVNPTHYAVALRWSRTQGAAPVCIAKGVDKVAASIREAAAKAGVPVRSDPPAARSIHALVEIGSEIREEHYRAVAAAIHFAETVRRKSAREET